MTVPSTPLVLLLSPGADVPARLLAHATTTPGHAPVLVACTDASSVHDLREVLTTAASVGLAPVTVDSHHPATAGLPRVELVIELAPVVPPAPVPPATGGVVPPLHPDVLDALLSWAARREAELGAQLQEATARAESGDLAVDRLARTLADREALADQLEQARRTTDMLTQDLNRLRRSGPYRVGVLLGRAVREPRRSGAVTRELVGLARRRWRQRGSDKPVRAGQLSPAGALVPSAGTAAAAEPSGELTEAELLGAPSPSASMVTVRPARGSARMLLAHRSLQPHPRRRPVVAAVVTDVTAAALEPYVDLVVLHPHDAVDLVRRTDPDLVLVETAASGAGQPWAYLGYPGVAARHRALVDALDAARAAGRPVVLWGDATPAEAAALVTVPGLVDLRLGVGNPVVDSRPHLAWDRGVPWHLFAPAGFAVPGDPAAHARAGRVHLLDWDQRTAWSARRATLTALQAAAPIRLLLPAERVVEPGDLPAELARLAEPMPWSATPPVYRAAAAALASPFSGSGQVSLSVLEQLACGVRVISGPNPELRAALDPWITWVDLPDALASTTSAEHQSAALGSVSTLAEGLAAGALDPTDQVRQARAIFAAHATPVRLAELTRRLGVAADPLRDRRVLALADADGGVPAGLIDDVLAQQWRPTGVVLVADPGLPLADHDQRAAGPDGARPAAAAVLSVPDAVDRLTASGVPAVVAPAVDSELLADAAWAARWSPDARWRPSHVLDALATVEAASGRADAVLPGPGLLSYRSDLPEAPALVRVACLPAGRSVAEVWPMNNTALAGWAAAGRSVLSGGGMVG